MAGDVEEQLPTRERLLAAGMRLFARQGFGPTSVGQIEEAVGLKPRRGTLYKHFPSKEALLHAAVERHVENARTFVLQAEQLDAELLRRLGADEFEALARTFGQWFLVELDAHRDLTHAFEHDPERLAGLVELFRAEVVEPGYRLAARLIEAVADPGVDHEAVASLLLGALVALRRTAWTFGRPPLDVTDERALDAWSRQCLSYRSGPSAR